MKLNKISLSFCTSCGIGSISSFPGTLASFLTLIPVWFIKENLGFNNLILIIFIYGLISFFCIKNVIQNQEEKDPSFIVADEHLGQAISLIFCEQRIFDFFFAFLLFRFFDILKPFPISFFDKIKNSSGVLLDDIVAGLFVCLIFLIFYAI